MQLPVMLAHLTPAAWSLVSVLVSCGLCLGIVLGLIGARGHDSTRDEPSIHRRDTDR